MAQDKTAIVVGIGPSTLSVAGSDCGFIKDPLVYRAATTYFDATNQNTVGAVKSKMISRVISFSTALHEMKLDYLRIASNLPTSALVSLNLTIANTTLDEVAIIVVSGSGGGGDGKVRTITTDAATLRETGDITLLDANSDVKIPLNWQANYHTGNTRYCLMVDA